MIKINEDWCKGCEICIKRCPTQSLEKASYLNKKGVNPPKLKEENQCSFCRLCELLCPDQAIMVLMDEEKLPKQKKNKLIIGGVANEI